jgi:uncharacterized protein (DUF58 family)
MRPSKRALWLFTAVLCLALVVALLRINDYENISAASSAWLSLAVISLMAMIMDWFNTRASANTFSIRRTIPGSLSIGKAQAVFLEIKNNSTYTQHLEVFEHMPQHFVVREKTPFTVSLRAGESTQLRYHVVANERGNALLEATEIRFFSRMGLWNRKQFTDIQNVVNVYPDFMEIAHLDALHDQYQAQQLGLHQIQRRGQGTDFRQLRDYHSGDALKNVDWKATSRLRKLITRDYQDERDQEVVFLLDCGRSMRSKDDALSHFDHCLNALLLSSYIALRHGDSVSVMTFAGQHRHLNAVKGQHNINSILNGVYDLHNTLQTADYLQVAKNLINKQRKRSLIIVITNISSDASDELLAATRLLSAHHLVMVASIQETTLQTNVQKPVTSMDDALLYCSSVNHFNQRQHLLGQLQNEGIMIVDSKAQTMHRGLLNEYTALKRSGRF